MFALRTLLPALAAAALLPSAQAAPWRRQEAAAANATAANANNVLVLQFAQVLNQLEQQFYTQALAKFSASDITSAGFTSATLVVQQLTAIASDESSHITALQAGLSGLNTAPLANCKFDFSSVLTDVGSVAALARMVENVGVGAFLGAADLISDPTLLTAAASILTVEARHQTVLNALMGGAAVPAAFDIPLLPQEVLTIAGPFLTGSGCELPVPANAAITITNTEAIAAGTTLALTSPALNSTNTPTAFCQLLAGGMPFSLSMPLDACVVPAGMAGPVAAFVTKDAQPLNNNARDRTDVGVLAGPAVFFVDQPQALTAMLKSGGVSSTVRSIVTPEEASAILAASGATATPVSAPAA